jgi:transcriptional regulator with XRE-family HTH domain
MAKHALGPEDKKFLVQLGKRLRAVRTAKKWTLEETEEHGWPGEWQHLQKIESGKNVTVVTIKRIAKLYGMSVSELLTGL